VPWINLSILPSIISWTRETGKTALFASESLVKSDGGGLSDFATGPSPFPDTPWQEAQDRRNSFRPGFSSGCACITSIVLIIAEAANKNTHHVVRMSLRPLRVCPFKSRSLAAKKHEFCLMVVGTHHEIDSSGTAASLIQVKNRSGPRSMIARSIRRNSWQRLIKARVERRALGPAKSVESDSSEPSSKASLRCADQLTRLSRWRAGTGD
jgi:hypothetical protein